MRRGDGLAVAAADAHRVTVGGHRAGVREVEGTVVAVAFQRVELPAAVVGVQARSQGDDRPVGELDGRLDVRGRLRSAGLPLGPRVDGIGRANPRDGAEPVDQHRQRVHRAVVQRADRQEGVGSIVPLGHPADVGRRVDEPHVAEAAVRQERPGVALGVAVGGDRRAAEREIAVPGERQEAARLRRVERERLLGENVAVGLQTRPSHRRVGGVAREVDDEGGRLRDEHRVEVGVDGGGVGVAPARVPVGAERALVGDIGGERLRPFPVEVADGRERQRRGVEPDRVLAGDRAGADEQTIHTRSTDRSTK
ncbi:hypothetical protein GCM10009000_001180 [Halobacterium noricense]